MTVLYVPYSLDSRKVDDCQTSQVKRKRYETGREFSRQGERERTRESERQKERVRERQRETERELLYCADLRRNFDCVAKPNAKRI